MVIQPRGTRSRSTSAAPAFEPDLLDMGRLRERQSENDMVISNSVDSSLHISPTHSRPNSRPASRAGSRSSSIHSQQAPENLGLRPKSVDGSSSKVLRKSPSTANALAATSNTNTVAGSRAPRASSTERSHTQLSLARDSLDSQLENRSIFDGHLTTSIDPNRDFDDVASHLGTGYAVASSKRNADFHSIFKGIPDDDYLIEDYGCALQREILIQGRLYISEHHLSFNANIFGWVTTLIIPFAEVVSIEKRMTAYVIPNAIQVTTLHARHVFASFLSRDTTYDLVGSIWRMVHPVVPPSAALPDTNARDASDDNDSASGDSIDEGSPVAPKRTKRRLRGLRRRGDTTNESISGEGSKGFSRGANGSPHATGGGRDEFKFHAVTTDTCPLLVNLKEVCMDTMFPSSPEKIYNLMFTSGFMKQFWTDNQKLTEIEMSDWAPQASGSNLLARSISYIKPLTAPIGPKQTKCVILDENAHVDFDDFVCVITTTRTPDVPSGTAFAVKTRTSMTWAKNNSCRVRVTTGVEWSKSSFIKGIVEKSCIEGQKTYHNDLELAMRTYIQQHRSEFMAEGQDATTEVLSTEQSGDIVATDSERTTKGDADAAANSASTNSLAFVLKTVASIVPGGSLLPQSPVGAGLGFVVLVLLLSNLWTLSSRSRSAMDRHAQHLGSVGDRTPDQVALAVREVLREYFASNHATTNAAPTQEHYQSVSRAVGSQDRSHLDAMRATIEELEAKIASLRSEIDTRSV
ncbi:hypothetical protein OIO90_005743 [Microbotryomycetes sp. JL221]|nr:hypothetical protein OIO90_005743 [Microbotryomycetes sp. JL221]